MKIPPAPNLAYLLLGANLGAARATFTAVRAALAAYGPLVAVSSLYQTAPWGGAAVAGQPAYLNQAVAVRTLLDPFRLLATCQALEATHGRQRSAADRWAARPLDIDILLFGGLEIEFGDDLILPHPRLAQRRFALVPLAEIAPHVLVPGRPRRTVAELLAACPDAGRVEAVPGGAD